METWIYITWGGGGGGGAFTAGQRTSHWLGTNLHPRRQQTCPEKLHSRPKYYYIYTMTKTRDPFNSQFLSSVSQLLPPHKCPEWKPAGWGQRVVCFVLKYTSALQVDKTFCHQPTRGMTDITINQRGYYLPHVTEFQYWKLAAFGESDVIKYPKVSSSGS